MDLSRYQPGPPEQELARLADAVGGAAGELRALASRMRAVVGEEEAAVVEAHLELLRDPALLDPVRDAVADGEPAAPAWQRQVTGLNEQLAALSDAYQRDRARDVTEVGGRVLRRLVDQGEDARPDGAGDSTGGEPAVLVLDDLDVGTAATLDGAGVAGVVTLRGGATGHGVLVARARGFPVITGAGQDADVPDGTLLAVDARRQQLHVGPDEPTWRRLAELRESRRQRREQALAAAREPGRTADGVRVAVEANLGTVAEAGPAVAAGADGCGLLRTEVLFAGWRQTPTVAEQVQQLTVVAEALQGRPLTVRTWDVGGDKPLPFLPVPVAANPFLGVRGLRVFREAPGPLVDQLEAVCRVAARYPVRVLVPMVTTRAEVEWTLARLDEAAGRLPGGRPDGLEVGVMLEVPGAALRVAELSAGLDFVSIGSNDLTQYLLAAERGNPALAELADHADPAVLRLVRTVCQEVPDPVQVALCGDAASDPALAALLVGLGVRELSATAATVPDVKAVLRRSALPELEALARRAGQAGSAAEVRQLLEPLRD
ncbi:phosphoenolpyruvate--protein phosphotransferase [Ornithinicoccus halotolerans]|uniref:phosphoenolpyruvate--protein phosphotransferase n=1 Tax=Ornithinicoccus halotolerans TaxID=1748220 RepID=UPI0012981560|nr:putative PEP-binding protein [Ornithinicoccus halotolerans]